MKRKPNLIGSLKFEKQKGRLEGATDFQFQLGDGTVFQEKDRRKGDRRKTDEPITKS